MTSSQTTTYPGMHVTIPNPYPPTSSMALHPQQPLGFLNIGNQVQTGQLSFITSPGIFTTSQLGLENVPMVHPAPGITTTNTNFKDAAIALGVSIFATRILMLHLQGFHASVSYNSILSNEQKHLRIILITVSFPEKKMISLCMSHPGLIYFRFSHESNS